jgi:hypothetical protein
LVVVLPGRRRGHVRQHRPQIRILAEAAAEDQSLGTRKDVSV